MTADELETAVRRIATAIWDSEAKPELVNGVKVDGVIRLKPDHWICIEITKNEALSKLREDLAKFATVRPFLWSKQIYAECYFVTEDEPTDALVTGGSGQNVTVLSHRSFQKKVFDFENTFTSALGRHSVVPSTRFRGRRTKGTSSMFRIFPSETGRHIQLRI